MCAIQVCCAYRDFLENIFQILCTLSQLCVLLICIMIGWEEGQGSEAQGEVMDMAMNLGTALLIFGAMRAAVMNITAIVSCECCADSIKERMRDSLAAHSINQESLNLYGVATISQLMHKLLKAGIEASEATVLQIESVSEAIKSAEAIVPDVADVADKGLLDKGTDVALDGLKLLKTTAEQALCDKLGCEQGQLVETLTARALEKLQQRLEDGIKDKLLNNDDDTEAPTPLQVAVRLRDMLAKAELTDAEQQIANVVELLERPQTYSSRTEGRSSLLEELKEAASATHDLSAKLTEDKKGTEAEEAKKLATLLDEATAAEEATNKEVDKEDEPTSDKDVDYSESITDIAKRRLKEVDKEETLALVTNSLLDFFLDGQAEEKLADQCNQFSIQMVTKETMKRGLETATADETEAVDDADAAPTMADVGLEAPTLDENDISLDIKIQDPEEVEVQACVLEKASELLQDLQADIVCWLSSEENWPPTSIETVLKYEIALQQKLAEMHQKAKDKCMTDELQQAADEFVKDKGFVVDTGIIVEKVLNGPMEKAVRQTVDAIENRL